VAVIAAGERWPDGGGRPHAGPLWPAVEDLLGAGAVIAATVASASASLRASLSPEARAALAAFRAAEADLPGELLLSVSGQELAAGGWADDVAAAAALDADTLVPVLVDGAYTGKP
jgi:2-phosphosulfolactate phosphatase